MSTSAQRYCILVTGMQSSKLTYDTMLVEMQNYNYITILITVNINSMAACVTDDISVLIKRVLDLEELQADVPSTKEIKEVIGKFESFDGTEFLRLLPILAPLLFPRPLRRVFACLDMCLHVIITYYQTLRTYLSNS